MKYTLIRDTEGVQFSLEFRGIFIPFWRVLYLHEEKRTTGPTISLWYRLD